MAVNTHALAAFILALTVSGALGQFGQTFQGDGTYYAFNGNGHCSFQFGNGYSYEWKNGISWFAAINRPQYGLASLCGMCIKFRWAAGWHCRAAARAGMHRRAAREVRPAPARPPPAPETVGDGGRCCPCRCSCCCPFCCP